MLSLIKQISLKILIILMVLLVINPGRATAASLPSNDRNAINLDTVWHVYDYNEACSIGNPNLLGNDNQEKAFRFFVQKGLTPIQSAGIIGNMMQESGVDPERIQGAPRRSKNPADSGSKGWGIIQWTPGSKILGIASGAGISTPIYELGTQLEIVWWHLNNVSPTGAKNVLPGLKNTTSIDEAVAYFEEKVEGAGKPALANRIRFANDALTTYGGSTNNSISGASSCSSLGGGQFIDGFKVYSQYDPKWKNLPYASSTIGESGCAPSAMAMIITALTGIEVSPVETANYAASQDMYIPGQGSKWTIAPVLAKRWGLNAEPIGSDLAKITAALQQGKLVITSGQGAKPFTSGGHYIVIRGLSSSGNFLIGDSAHNDTSDKEWSPDFIISNMKAGSVYAISK